MVQVHKLSLYETAGYLRSCLDNAKIPQLQLADEKPFIENHVKLLLMDDLYRSNDIRSIMSDLLPTEQASEIGDTVHDMLLNDLRTYMCLDDDDERIVNINVSNNFDLTIEVEELNRIHLT